MWNSFKLSLVKVESSIAHFLSFISSCVEVSGEKMLWGQRRFGRSLFCRRLAKCEREHFRSQPSSRHCPDCGRCIWRYSGRPLVETAVPDSTLRVPSARCPSRAWSRRPTHSPRATRAGGNAHLRCRSGRRQQTPRGSPTALQGAARRYRRADSRSPGSACQTRSKENHVPTGNCPFGTKLWRTHPSVRVQSECPDHRAICPGSLRSNANTGSLADASDRISPFGVSSSWCQDTAGAGGNPCHELKNSSGLRVR